LEVAGTIATLGPRYRRSHHEPVGGRYVDSSITYTDHLIAIPENFGLEQAACVCETYITAYLNVLMLGELEDGEAARETTSKRGADVILDQFGGKYLAGNLKALAVGGRLVIIGPMGRAKAEINLGALMVKRQQVIGSVLRSRSVAEKAEIVAQFTNTVMPLFEQGAIEPLIHAVLPLEQASEAHRMMEASEHFSKIVLRP